MIEFFVEGFYDKVLDLFFYFIVIVLEFLLDFFIKVYCWDVYDELYFRYMKYFKFIFEEFEKFVDGMWVGGYMDLGIIMFLFR